MLITDQWINSTPVLRSTADTSLVYEPILKKYGYTADDYRRSIDYYLNDPDDYADIMSETVKILDRKLAELRRKKDGIDEDKAFREHIKKLAKEVNFSEAALYLSLYKDDAYGHVDSLAVLWDTLAWCYTIRPAMKVELEPVSDSLAVSDTIPQLDTLDVIKDLPVLDTLTKLDTAKKIVKPRDLKPSAVRPFGSVKPAHTINVSDTLARI